MYTCTITQLHCSLMIFSSQHDIESSEDKDGMVVEIEEEAFMYRAVVLVEVVVVTVHGAV